jgi:hypothetical protein
MQRMSSPIRRELDLAWLAAREQRLRLVIEILRARDAGDEGAGRPTRPGLRQSMADLGTQLGDVRRRGAELASERRPARGLPVSTGDR